VENTFYNNGLLQPIVTTMKLRERNVDSEIKGSKVRNLHIKMEAHVNELDIETRIVVLKERLNILKEFVQ
jgi:hypothetical protein